MKKIMISVISLLILPSAFACSDHVSPEQGSNQKIEKCDDLKCVRAHIDEVNKEIISLLAQRMEYVNQAGQIKLKNNIATATDEKRANEVVEKAEKFGKAKGLPDGFTKDVFQVIVDKSAHFEQKEMDAKVSKKN
jgi:chorismate mutase